MKIINVKVIANAAENSIEEDGDDLKVQVTAPTEEGKANKMLFEILVKHLKVKKGDLKIMEGEDSEDKVVRILKRS